MSYGLYFQGSAIKLYFNVMINVMNCINVFYIEMAGDIHPHEGHSYAFLSDLVKVIHITECFRLEKRS